MKRIALGLLLTVGLAAQAQAADVAGWKITCTPSSLSFSGTESKTFTCTTTAPAGHNSPYYDYQYLFKQGGSWESRSMSTFIPNTTPFSKTYTIFGQNVNNGDKLEIKAYDRVSSAQYRKLMATSNAISISKGGTTPPPSGNWTVSIRLVEVIHYNGSVEPFAPGETKILDSSDKVKYCFYNWSSSTDPDNNDVMVLSPTGSSMEWRSAPAHSGVNNCSTEALSLSLAGYTMEARYIEQNAHIIRAVSAEKFRVQ